MGLIGWCYGYTWKKAVTRGGPWSSQLVILCALTLYLVMQTMEAVIFPHPAVVAALLDDLALGTAPAGAAPARPGCARRVQIAQRRMPLAGRFENA